MSIRSFVAISCGVSIGVLYIVALTARHGIGVTTDSVHYLAAASNLAEVGQLVTYTGLPLVSYAPLLSIFCSLGCFLGIKPEVSAVVINLISYATVVWLTYVWLDEVIGEQKAALVTAATVLSPPMIWVVSFVLSEPLFIAVTLAALRCLWRFAMTRDSWLLICSSVLGSAAALTRYIGVSVIVTSILFLLLYYYGHLRKRISHAIMYSLVSGSPVMLWLLRNKLRSGSFFGDRETSNYPLAEILSDSYHTLLGWFLPDRAVESLIGYLLGGVAILLLLFLGYAIARRWNQIPQATSAQINVVTLFVGSYSFLLMLSSATVKFSHLDTRYWSPTGVPLILLISTMFYVAPISSRWRKTIAAMILVLTLLWSGSGIVMATRFIRFGYPNWWTGMVTNSKFESSEAISYIRRLQPNGAIYTNYPEHLYYLTGVVSYWLPRKSLQAASEGFLMQLHAFVKQLGNDAQAGREI